MKRTCPGPGPGVQCPDAAELERLHEQVARLEEEKRQLVVLCEAIGAKARNGEIPRFWESSARG
jgi:hypothetical protein